MPIFEVEAGGKLLKVEAPDMAAAVKAISLHPNAPQIPPGFRAVGFAPPDDLMKALWWQESRNNPTAVSPKGAMGIGQVMPATARDPGFGVAPLNDPFNPEQNKRFSREYLGAMLNRYGNEADALVAYNWGPGNADRWIRGGRNPDALPAETRNYVQSVLGSVGEKPHAPRVTAASNSTANGLPPGFVLDEPDTPEASTPRVPAGFRPIPRADYHRMFAPEPEGPEPTQPGAAKPWEMNRSALPTGFVLNEPA